MGVWGVPWGLHPAVGVALQGGRVGLRAGWDVLWWSVLICASANWAHTAGLVLGVAWGALEGGDARGGKMGAA